MPDYLLQENSSYLLKEQEEPILLESSLFQQTNNYEHGFVVKDGISVTEKIK